MRELVTTCTTCGDCLNTYRSRFFQILHKSFEKDSRVSVTRHVMLPSPKSLVERLASLSNFLVCNLKPLLALW